MITAEEFVLEIENSEESKNFKLATVVELFDNDTAKLKFDGEETASEKQYAYLDSYVPKIDDRVLLGILGGTYVILGKVNYNVSPSTEEEIDRYIFDLKTVSILKGLQVSGALTINNGATIVGNVGVNGNINAVEISASGALKGNSIFTTGNLDAGTTTLSSLSVSGGASVSGAFTASSTFTANSTFNANSIFQHKGTLLGVFNQTATNRRNISNLSGTATTEANRDKINEILNAMKAYGFFG